MAANPSAYPITTLRLRTYRDGQATVVNCAGRLLAENAKLLRDEVKALIPQTQWIVLDLSNLKYMDSAGLGTVVSLYVSAKTANCRFEMINLNARVRQLLGITRMFSVFEACGKYLVKFP